MFKLKNVIVSSVLVLSASTLVGCSQLAEQIRGIEKKEVAPNPETVEVNGKELKLPDNSIVDVEAQTKGKPLEKGFKVVGDERYGYFQIPENFVTFKDVSAKDPDMKQFSDATGTFILTFKPLPEGIVYENAVAGLVEGMRKAGPSVVANQTEINGNKAMQLFQYYQKDDYTLNVYVLNEGDSLKYISIEYRGKQEELKNKILDLYSNIEPTDGP